MRWACFLPEEEIYGRSLTSIEDSIETLAYKGHDTPYFHDRRFRSSVRSSGNGRPHGG
jgi:hypothetical protein